MPYDAVRTVTKAIHDVGKVRTVLLSDTGEELAHGVEIVEVLSGTKLSKIRRLSQLIDADLFCICDPDLVFEEQACRAILLQAVADAKAGNEVVAFGIVEGRDDGTLLSKLMVVDKYLSHRVLRPVLFSAGIGITLPGQFLILSRGVLRDISPRVDSYLDDLYLGWVAWHRGLHVHRVPAIVGKEEPRKSWLSLLSQRIRWMKGLASLVWFFSSDPTALALLLIHYTAFHGVPILIGLVIWRLSFINVPVAIMLFTLLAAALAKLTRQRLRIACCYLAVFPCLHLVVSLCWWLPLRKSLLRR
jgi:cellulose synthase/poly-beta-1,6-N-acetylglucosamine synthase-like glycosyltransferase